MPLDRATFQAEWDRVCREVLEMNDAVRFVLDLLDQRLPKFNDRVDLPDTVRSVMNTRLLRSLVSHPSKLVAIGGLPAIVRERFDIPWSTRDQLELKAIETAVRQAWPLLPASARWQPAAASGWRRTTGKLP